MQFTSERRLDDGVLEREFTLGEIPGILWTPASAPAPLILLGHPGGLRMMHPQLVARADLRRALEGGRGRYRNGGRSWMPSFRCLSRASRPPFCSPEVSVPRSMFEEALQVTIPLQVLLQWDDEGNDREASDEQLIGAGGTISPERVR